MVRERLATINPRERMIILCGVIAVLGLCCFIEWRRSISQSHSYQALVRRVTEMSADSAQIAGLANAPRAATERARPNDELLAGVQQAIATAKIPVEHWIGNEPTAAVRVPKTDYKRLDTRLSFQELSVRDVVTFVYHLTGDDPALSVPYVRLSLPPNRTDVGGWDVELVISYLIYSPVANTG